MNSEDSNAVTGEKPPILQYLDIRSPYDPETMRFIYGDFRLMILREVQRPDSVGKDLTPEEREYWINRFPILKWIPATDVSSAHFRVRLISNFLNAHEVEVWAVDEQGIVIWENVWGYDGEGLPIQTGTRYFLIPAIPTDEELTNEFIRRLLYNNGYQLEHLLGFHSNSYAGDIEDFIKYIGGLLSHQTLKTGKNKIIRQLLYDWWNAQNSELQKIYAVNPSVTLTEHEPAEPGVKLRWKGDKTDLAELIWALAQSGRITDTSTGNDVTQKLLAEQLTNLLGVESLDIANLMKGRYGTKSRPTTYKVQDGKTFINSLQTILERRTLD